LLLLYSFQFRSAFRAAPARHGHCFRHRHIPELNSGFHSSSDVSIKTDGWTDRRTDRVRHTCHNTLHPYWGRCNNSYFKFNVLHLPTSRPASLVTDWTPEGGSRRWGRPKPTWQDTCREDLQEIGVSGSDTHDARSIARSCSMETTRRRAFQ